MDLFDILRNHAALFLLVLMRISGIFVVAPFFGSQNIPSNFRVAAALTITFVLFPVIDGFTAIRAPATVEGYAFAVLFEVLIGWLIGMIAFITLSAIHMAGKVMDMQVGFAMVQVLDPTSGQQIPLIGSFLYNLTLIIFVMTNGHHLLINALFESFRLVPVLGMDMSVNLPLMIRDFTAAIFLTGMKIALPVTFAVLLTNTGLAILARMMPQLNIFVVGVPMHICIGLFVLSIMLPFFILFTDVLFNEMYAHISIALKALASS